jgi:histidine triad (HIT) family protein
MTVLLSGFSSSGLVPRAAVAGAAALPRASWPAASSAEVRRELERLTNGMTFMSESDFPVDVVIWRRPGGVPTAAARLAFLTGAPAPETGRVTTVDDFFRAAAQPPRASDAEERAVARRFQRLAEFLKARLAGALAFRFGCSTGKPPSIRLCSRRQPLLSSLSSRLQRD